MFLSSSGPGMSAEALDRAFAEIGSVPWSMNRANDLAL
jgi:hypothetical protein